MSKTSTNTPSAMPTDSLDLTDAGHLDAVREMADGLLEMSLAGAGPEVLEKVERDVAEQSPAPSLAMRVAAKLALSRARLDATAQPHHVSVVFAVYKEHHRILTPAEHAHGEDFLRRKLQQLCWLFDDTVHTWDLTVVDDGCPEGSGELAQKILADYTGDQPTRVLFLRDGIAARHGALVGLSDPADSQKGGSILYGMAEAARQQLHEPHVIVFTDADLSTHLGQLGLLIDGIARGGADAAIGSRREALSVVVKKGKRNVRGKLFIYLWKQLLTPLRYITDTQCGFKAFRAELFPELVEGNLEKRFAFDIELLLETELANPGSIAKIPVAWIDSEAASTTTDIGPYRGMLQSAAAIYRHYLPASPRAEEIAGFLDSLDDDSWSRLVNSVPAAIADADPSGFGDEPNIDVEELERLARA